MPAWKLEFNRKEWPADFVVDELVLRDEGAGSALPALARALRAELRDVAPSVVRIERSPRITLSVADAPLRDVARLVADLTGLRVRADADTPDAKSTIIARDVSAPTLLEAVADAIGGCAVARSDGGMQLVPASSSVIGPVPPAPRGHLRAPLDAPVTIELRDVAIGAVVEEFRNQVLDMNFEIDANGWPSGYRIEEFVVRDMPWRTALQSLAVRSGAVVVKASPSLLRLVRPARATLSVKGVILPDFLKLLSSMTGASFVIRANIRGRVSVECTDAPWTEALRMAVDAADCTAIPGSGGIYRIVPGRQAAPPPPTVSDMLAEIGEVEPDRAAMGDLRGLIERLNSDDVGERDAAETTLATKGRWAAWLLRRALQRPLSGEHKARLERAVRLTWEAME